jgi:hypothetical protein
VCSFRRLLLFIKIHLLVLRRVFQHTISVVDELDSVVGEIGSVVGELESVVVKSLMVCVTDCELTSVDAIGVRVP